MDNAQDYTQFKNTVFGPPKHMSWANRFSKTFTFVTENPQYQMTIGLIPCDETSFFVHRIKLAEFFGLTPNAINCDLRQHGMDIVNCPEANYPGRCWTKRRFVHGRFDALSASQYAREFRYGLIPGKGRDRTFVQFAPMAPITAPVTAVSDVVALMRDAVSGATPTADAQTDANAAGDADTAVAPLSDALSDTTFRFEDDIFPEDGWRGGYE
jgi:hypothetical protein